MDQIDPQESKEKVVVSMTSFPPAIEYAIKAIDSILNGSVLPDKLVLYLSYSQFEEGIPSALLEIAEKNPIFEIRNFEPDIRSYRKLIPALCDFPDAAIVTIDDDVLYHRDMLRDLLAWHDKFPDTIIAHRVKKIRIGKPYKKWSKYRWYDFLFNRVKTSFHNIPTGVGGVLYPPHALTPEMLNIDDFTRLAPTNDDIWFWASAVANNVPVMPVPFGFNKPKGLGKPKSISLKTKNFKSGTDLNIKAFDNILEAYPQVGQKLGIGCNLESQPIDLVYLWVDGSDPKWRAKHEALRPCQTHSKGTDCEGRYANFDELKYSLRSIEKYAPWINKIYIVTDEQVPQWLNTQNSKIQIVDHKEILPAEALPCFNSTVLEHHLHKIPGLSERFLYANDDMLLNKPLSKADFFIPEGLPIVRLNFHVLRKLKFFYAKRIRHKRIPNYKWTIHKTAKMVARKYGRYLCSRTHHNIDAYLKSDMQRAYSLFKNEIEPTIQNHFRQDNDVQRNLYTYVPLLEKRCKKEYVSRRCSFRLHIDNQKYYSKFKKYNPTFFCMNDSEYATNEDRVKSMEFLQKVFPEKSQFEK